MRESVVKSIKGDINQLTTEVTGVGQMWLVSKIDEWVE